MSAAVVRRFRAGGGSRVVAAVLVMLLLGGVAERVHAQEQPDTSDTTAAGVEPAGLDSLSTGDVAPPGAPPSPETPASDTGAVERVFVNADSLSAVREGEERVQELFGDVFIRQDTTRLRSEYARRYLEREEVLFINDVFVYERGDTLRADTVRYDRATEVGHARGDVRLTDGQVEVRAPRGTYFAEEKRSVFPDSVVLVDSARTLEARHGTYWSDDRRAEFGGRVRLTQPGTTILSDSLTYYRDRDRSVARGNVFIDRQGEGETEADSSTRTYLFGDRVDNREQHRYTRVAGRALLVRVRSDSTGAPTDTLAVRAHRLEAFRTDTHRRLIAVDSVRVWQPDLSAVADSAVYDRVVATTSDTAAGETVPIDTARPLPDSLGLQTEAQPDTSEIVADTSLAADSMPVSRSRDAGQTETARDSTVRAPADEAPSPDTTERSEPGQPGRETVGRTDGGGRWPTPTTESEAQLPLEEIRLYRDPMTWFEDSQVWGDSIRVLARNRSPDTVFVRGSAFTVRRDTALDRLNQLKARNLTAYFRSDSLDRIVAQPNAEAIYFLASESDSLLGAKEASGDRFLLYFSDGSVQRAVWKGGVQGVGYPEIENIPEPFELEGFRWTPERRPTLSKLLRDSRVRRRLDLEAVRPSRPIARRPQGGAPRGGERALSPERPGSTVPSPPVDSLQTVPSVPPDSSRRRPDSRVSPPDTSDTNSNPNP